MPRVLVTAFRPFDAWTENASWLALQALTRDLPDCAEVVTRLYPVDYAEARQRLAADLASGIDLAIHVGQAAGAPGVRLESFALNSRRAAADEPAGPLEADGPAAYRSVLPLADWSTRLASAGIPSTVSHDAGDYPCNAALYWSHHLAADPATAAAVFVHVPLDLSQAAAAPEPIASLPSEYSAMAVRLLIEWGTQWLAERDATSPAAAAGGIA